MELYLLNTNLEREVVVDQFTDLIWTERYQSPGEFSVVIPAKFVDPQSYYNGRLVTLSTSDRIMVIDSISETGGDDGDLVTIEGRSFEAIFGSRSAMLTLGYSDARREVYATPASVMNAIFDSNLGPGGGAPTVQDKIEGLSRINDPYGMSNAAWPVWTFARSLTHDVNIGEIFQTICKESGLGYAVIYIPESAAYRYTTYNGYDRTLSQDDVSPVVFAPSYDYLTDVRSLVTNRDQIDIVYVAGVHFKTVVYRAGADSGATGLNRRVATIDASSVTTEDSSQAMLELNQLGQNKINETTPGIVYEGTITELNPYIYRQHYNLGDLCVYQSPNGIRTVVRVTEVIHTYDGSGPRIHPTLSVEGTYEPNTWGGQDADVWEDKGATDYWSTEP